MSYNGSGTFQINTSGQPVVTGTSISSTVFNALTADLATGLSTAITKDGQTTTTARIPFALGINSTLVTDATNTTSGSIITAGGVGIAKALYVGTTANVAGAVTLGGVATFSAQPIFSSLTASSAVATDASKGLVSVTNTGTGNNVLATAPTIASLNLTTALTIASAAGTVGQALTSGGASAAPTWSTIAATPGGSTTQVQYNNAGAFAGSANLVFDGTNLTSLGTVTGTKFIPTGSSATGNGVYLPAANSVGISTNGTEHARITATGYFKASDTGTYLGSADSYHELRQSDAGNSSVIINCTSGSYTGQAVQLRMARNTTNDTFYVLRYYNEGAAAYKFNVADSGNVTNTNGSYGAISDVKMKTDIVDAGSQWADIKAIRFRKYKMKDDPSGLVQLGVIAQELEQISPGLISELKDVDGEGVDLGTTTKSVKTSVLFMKSVKALQEAMIQIEEQQALITQLTARITALEGAA